MDPCVVFLVLFEGAHEKYHPNLHGKLVLWNRFVCSEISICSTSKNVSSKVSKPRGNLRKKKHTPILPRIPPLEISTALRVR